MTAEFPPMAVAVEPSRHLVRDMLAAWGLPGLQDDAELVLAEMFSNALRHAPDRLHRLELRVAADHVLIALSDASPLSPVRRSAGGTAVGGRGLPIIEALASRWGITPLTTGGKNFWVELPVVEPCPRCLTS